MSYPFSKAVVDAENNFVRDLIESVDDKIEAAIDAISEACGTGGNLSGHDCFILSGQILKLKSIKATVESVLNNIQPEKPTPSLDEDGEV